MLDVTQNLTSQPLGSLPMGDIVHSEQKYTCQEHCNI